LTLTVVGDIITFNALVEIQKLYGLFEPGAGQQTRAASPQPQAKNQSPHPSTQPAPRPSATDPRPPTEGEPATLRYKEERGDINQTIVTVGFRVPGASASERAALELLAAMLGQGRASRLGRSLLDSQMLVTRVAANYLPLGGDGLLAIQMQVASDAKGNSLIDRAEALLLQELDEA